MEELNFCSNAQDLQEEPGGKEMDAIEEGDINEKDIQGVDHGEPQEPEVTGDRIPQSAHIDTIQKDVNHEVSEETFGSGHHFDEATRSPESFTEEDTDSLDREPSDLTHCGEYGRHVEEEEDVQIVRKRNYSDLSTVRAESPDADRDSFILDVEGLNADSEYLLPRDSLSSDTSDREVEDVGLVPMGAPRVSLVSKDWQMWNELGAGSSAFGSRSFGITGADWHVASLTLGTVGISVPPTVSPGTIDINPFTSSIGMVPADPTDWETWSMDSVPLAGYVNVDSITPEGLREGWHPLEDRLHALGEALTALDKKIEGFSPCIQEAETLLNEVELSLSHQAVHISDIMKENKVLASA